MINTIHENINLIRESISEELDERILYSLLVSLTPNELIKLYWEYLEAENREVVVIQKVIINSINKQELTGFEQFISKCAKYILEKEYKKIIKVRSLISQLYNKIPENLLNELFFSLIKSKRKLDRRLACKISFLVSSQSVIDNLWNIWFIKNDEQGIKALINLNAITDKTDYEILKNIYSTDNIDEWIKRKMYKNIAKVDFEKLDFLKQTEFATYIYLAAINNYKIQDAWIYNKILEINDYNSLHFILWSLGKMKKTGLIMKIFQRKKKIKETIRLNIEKKYLNNESIDT